MRENYLPNPWPDFYNRTSNYIYTDIQLRIELSCGVITGGEKPKRRKRPKGKPRGYWTRYAFNIIEQVCGTWFETSQYLKTRPLAPEQQWLLEQIFFIRGIDYKQRYPRKLDFMIAVAKDAGVWPPPKWWLVTQRLSKKITHQDYQN